MDWIDLVQDMDRWRALVNAVKETFGFHQMRGISWLAEELLAFHECVCSMEPSTFCTGVKLCILPLACWDCGFESRRGLGCLSLVSVVRQRSLRRADHSSRGVLPSVVCVKCDREASNNEEA
jgi:hypothetical protein